MSILSHGAVVESGDIHQILARPQHVETAALVAPYARTTLTDASGRLPPSTGRLSEHPDGVLFESRAERLDGMARMLAGLGWDFDVITPDALRDEVLALSHRLRANAVREKGLAAPPPT